MEGFSRIIDQIKSRSHDLSDADYRIAEVVLARPREVVNMGIGKLSSLAKVSDPSVIRFCRSLGLDGYREFKIRLAQELAVGTYYVHREVSLDDDAATYVEKVGLTSVEMLSNIVKILDYKQIESVVSMLTSASRVEFWGFGASAAVALDAHHKFFRLGIHCTANTDSHMQCMSASTMNQDAVVVAISHTGRNRELIENTRLAIESGGSVIALTSSDSPLAHECSLALCVDLDEDTDVFPPMVSRLAHLLVLDILVVGVSLRMGQRVTERLKRMKKALSLKRVPGKEDNENA